MSHETPDLRRVRQEITVAGIVQGVGFRPFVFRLAHECGLGGFVRNSEGIVRLQVEGEPQAVDAFLHRLRTESPAASLIESVTCQALPPRNQTTFKIEPSDSDSTGTVFIAPDSAPCHECLEELFDPGDRRYRYPFLNCSQCGPRFTVITQAPYDRPHTTMATFSMCEPCRSEYEDPADRRFHAQPTACPVCGPRLEFRRSIEPAVVIDEPLRQTIDALKSGAILAIKGVGGFHLACRADCPSTIQELRRRKHRDEKPFAIMLPDVHDAETYCEISPLERELLTSAARPIVLLTKRRDGSLPSVIAPGNSCLGVMLPCSPLHEIVIREMRGIPLIMTSGNRSDEPIVYEDDDAFDRLQDIADGFLINNRPIHLRCDDSVVRVVNQTAVPIRRSRGYTPTPISLPFPCQVPTIALGGHLKATFALGRTDHAFLSHHLGDLDDYRAYEEYRKSVDHFRRLFDHPTELLVHDLHPDYATTRFARDYSAEHGLATRSVQHHHAHMASCMAEHGLSGSVMGVIFDGTGYGTDGTVWGGEFLVGSYASFRRAAHFLPVPMPGGTTAIREPWRMALAYLHQAGVHTQHLKDAASPSAQRVVLQRLERRASMPITSSAGRLFDGVAALIGQRSKTTFEGQAAIELEALAATVEPDTVYPFELRDGAEHVSGEPQLVDMRPLIRALVADQERGIDRARIARRFHSTLATIITHVCERLREQHQLNRVVLSGGVFLNALLLEEALRQLSSQGFLVYHHHAVPPNDGGLSLGQLAIASATTAVTTD